MKLELGETQHLEEYQKYRDDLQKIVDKDGDPEGYLKARIENHLDPLIKRLEDKQKA